MHPRELTIENFDYNLPETRIANYPKPKRDSSKLLIFKENNISEDVFRNVLEKLPADSLIVFNNTRVVEARIIFQKTTGARIEVFCLEPGPGYHDITTALGQHGSVVWKTMVGNASSWSPGMILEKKIKGQNEISLKAELLEKKSDHFLVQLSWNTDISFAELLHEAGLVPLPPYIKRKPDQEDAERYQTVYADHSGSVAAPTAGLHFTSEIVENLAEKNILKDFVTLHVGAGTFKPVKSQIMNDHDMHAEFIEVKRSLIENIYNFIDKPITAVGTTSLRTLESIYWIGRKLSDNENLTAEELSVLQWEPYDNVNDISAYAALDALLKWMDRTGTDVLITKTSLLIAPGYRFRIVTCLITNFHQPRSTLLLLVAAFIGENWKSVYAYALENDFRFLSYGDSCLFFRQ
jgi:S-adenosylmethionine:tRNA ribosyltransferase-isomerase